MGLTGAPCPALFTRSHAASCPVPAGSRCAEAAGGGTLICPRGRSLWGAFLAFSAFLCCASLREGEWRKQSWCLFPLGHYFIVVSPHGAKVSSLLSGALPCHGDLGGPECPVLARDFPGTACCSGAGCDPLPTRADRGFVEKVYSKQTACPGTNWV